MNREQALAYGKAHGCRYLVVNSAGGLLGGFKTKEAAEDCRRRWQKQVENDPLNSDVKVYVQEIEL